MRPLLTMLATLNTPLTPSAQCLAIAALKDPGPVKRRVWALRAGIGYGHVAEIITQLLNARVAVCERVSEGILILVQPPNFWRIPPLRPWEEWLAAWAVPGQARLDLRTEEPGLAEALGIGADLFTAPGFRANNFDGSPGFGATPPGFRAGDQFPSPEFRAITETEAGEKDSLPTGSDPKMRGTDLSSPCPNRPAKSGDEAEQPIDAQRQALDRPGKQTVAPHPDSPGPPGIGADFVAQRAPEIGAAKSGQAAAEGRAASPPSPTPPPPQERLNVERLTFNVQGATLLKRESEETAERSTLQRSKEGELMERIAAHVGRDDMAAWGASWRVHCVRKIPARVIEAALADREARRREGFEPKPDSTWGADLWYTVKKFAEWDRNGKL